MGPEWLSRYGDPQRLDGPGIESRCGARFSAPIRDRPWDPPSFVYRGYRVSFPGVKWAGHGVDYPPPSSDEVKEKQSQRLRLPEFYTVGT